MINKNKSKLIVVLLFFGITIYLVEQFFDFPEYLTITKYYSSISQRQPNNEIEEWQKQNNLNLKYINLTKFETLRKQKTTKFILLEITLDHWSGGCGRLANQIWAFAIIYVWGLQTDRYPGYFNNGAFSCDTFKNSPSEMEETFPVANRIFASFKPKEVEGDTIFHKEYNINEVIKTKEKYLRIHYPPLIHDLFKNIKNQVKELYSFSYKIRTIVDKYINEIFGNDKSHKLCIYTRLGDYGTNVAPKYHPSRKDFSEESAKFVFNEIKPKRVFTPKEMPRGHDIYFSTKICNSLIITASASTFGWWIGFLLDDINSKIYFYDDFHEDSMFQRKDLLSDWIPLKFNLNTKQIKKY
uniref:L-Fucosyltransferase n=1 Tax=Meloidogyne hapla TaxID=6305 RepID=A0A1I8BAE1_MELHA